MMVLQEPCQPDVIDEFAYFRVHKQQNYLPISAPAVIRTDVASVAVAAQALEPTNRQESDLDDGKTSKRILYGC